MMLEQKAVLHFFAEEDVEEIMPEYI